MKSFLRILLVNCVLAILSPSATASVYESNYTPGYIKKVVMRSIVDGMDCAYYYTFTCEHYLSYGESMAYEDFNTWSGDCVFRYYYWVDSITWIPVGGGSSSLSKASSQAYSGTDIFPNICNNAQNVYKEARWVVSLPSQITATASATGGVSLSKTSNIVDGDVITVTAGSQTGTYVVTLTPNGASSATASVTVFSFGFSSAVTDHISNTAGPGQANPAGPSVNATTIDPHTLAGASCNEKRGVTLTTSPVLSLSATVRSKFLLSFSGETQVKVNRQEFNLDGSSLSFTWGPISVGSTGLSCSGSTRGLITIDGQASNLSPEVTANNDNLLDFVPDEYVVNSTLTATSTSPILDFVLGAAKPVQIEIVAASKSEESALRVPSCYAVLNTVEVALASNASFQIQ